MICSKIIQFEVLRCEIVYALQKGTEILQKVVFSIREKTSKEFNG